MQVTEFNLLPLDDAKTVLKHCVNIPSWVLHLAEHRPYESKHTLIQRAQQQTTTWSWAEVKTSLDTHPRIGEKKAKQVLSAQEQALSEREQAGIAQDAVSLNALQQGNLDYEAKFGFIFLIKAAGLSSEDILEQLHQRLSNDIETEKVIVKQQLAQIAMLRLDQEIQA
ncbi:2-oxo-4-hydroxy-4-carboxy-5-ureidoimidazoline decarboxylase [Acinetobacter sp. MD2(2019)]|uniref:2-oxo-4-hydroxy-4-carboxy-5-ureidoimidazoline decarboxylase n=1 Tax=Acinetobacter sp. MD2(2019) TaxID=2605273 RepID=UPI002D1F6DAD|nr:2-oxo-4-hydroxy-4-carboxy-5-ureidoimidazoline decarboxylase [Acinetobacter sp. MD2(2019)]MEB3753139.1 2-oxo-4-hydroxy-4-carboxy-5-ureidoimidazoline decarboxylase [Acinetobacter sp. MD2(2019)]